VKSTGDEPGVAGGVLSAVFIMEASFISFSPTVLLDGKPACRLTDKMLMNKTNTFCMSGALNPPVPPAPPPADANQSFNPEDPKHCNVVDVYVKCGHADRGLPPISLWGGNEDVTLEVISKAHEPDTLTAEWEGTCEFGHASYCPQVVLTDDSLKRKTLKQGVGMEAPIRGMLSTSDPFWALKAILFNHEIPKAKDLLTAYVCEGHATADVNAGPVLLVVVYPEVGLKGTMSLGYKKDQLKDAKGNPKPLEYEEKSTWEIKGELESTFGANTRKLAGTGKMEALPMFGPLLKNIGWVSKFCESIGAYGLDVKIEPRWPLWEISGAEVKLVELKGKRKVGWEGSFKFGFNPLFGIQLSASILDWMIRFLGGLAGPPGLVLAKALVQVRKRFADGGKFAGGKVQANLDIDIQIVVGGTVKGGFGVKFVQGQSEIDGEASGIDGSVDLAVTGKVKGAGKVWKVTVAGVAQIGSSSAGSETEPSKIGGKVKLEPSKKNAFNTKGQLYFNGLAFYYLLYVEYGTGGADIVKKKDDQEGRSFEGENSSTTRVAEKKGKAVLLKAWSWPAEGATG